MGSSTMSSSTMGSSTMGSTVGSTTISFNGTTTSATSICDSIQNCTLCIKNMNCIWCVGSSACMSGHWFGPSDTCSDWRWKQCDVNGKYALLGAGGAVLLLLISLFLCVFCCCCCRKKNNRKQLKDFKEFKAVQMEEEQSLISKHPKTDSRRAEIMKKYGSKLNTSNA